MSGGEELVIGAPGPRAQPTRMVHIANRPARAYVPYLDDAVLPPRSQAHAVGTKRYGTQRRFVSAQDMGLPSCLHVPDMNRSVVEACSQLAAVRTPREPLARTPPMDHRRWP